MKEFLFESIRGKKVSKISVGEHIKDKEKHELGNSASLHLNKKKGFFIYLLIESLNEKQISDFLKDKPEFRILTEDDKSYMLVNFTPNFPIFEFLFDITIYKNLINKKELINILENTFKIALVNNSEEIKAIKEVQLEKDVYNKFEKTLLNAFENPNFSMEYRVFLIPFYEKSTDRWWNIIKE